MKYILTESQFELVKEDMDLDTDPCFEKSVKFYQSKEGRELLDLMRKQIDSTATNPKFKLTRDEKKRLKYLVRLTPKC